MVRVIAKAGHIEKLEIQLSSSSCEGLQPLAASEGPLGPKVLLSEEQTYERITGLRELDRETETEAMEQAVKEPVSVISELFCEF